ncbi:response regulator [Candidatus Woesearchaeota archaeon]|nr:response regulator [Candidatus Woesearchaeota archaeon]
MMAALMLNLLLEKALNSKSGFQKGDIMEKKKILVVEDDQDTIDIYKEILDKEYDLLVAEDTKKARELLEKHKPDLMILDIILPEESGDAFLAQIKDSNKYKRLKVLAVTVLGDVTYELCKIDPDVVSISKPFDKAKLLKTIKDMM